MAEMQRADSSSKILLVEPVERWRAPLEQRLNEAGIDFVSLDEHHVPEQVLLAGAFQAVIAGDSYGNWRRIVAVARSSRLSSAIISHNPKLAFDALAEGAAFYNRDDVLHADDFVENVVYELRTSSPWIHWPDAA